MTPMSQKRETRQDKCYAMQNNNLKSQKNQPFLSAHVYVFVKESTLFAIIRMHDGTLIHCRVDVPENNLSFLRDLFGRIAPRKSGSVAIKNRKSFGA
jgi:hypothetical protein